MSILELSLAMENKSKEIRFQEESVCAGYIVL